MTLMFSKAVDLFIPGSLRGVSRGDSIRTWFLEQLALKGHRIGNRIIVSQCFVMCKISCSGNLMHWTLGLLVITQNMCYMAGITHHVS